MATNITSPIQSSGTVIKGTTMDDYFKSQIQGMRDQQLSNGFTAGASLVSAIGQAWGMSIQAGMQTSQFNFQEKLAGIERDIDLNAEREKQAAINFTPEAEKARIDAELRLQNARQTGELIVSKTTELKKTEATAEAVTRDPRRAYEYGNPSLSIG